MVYNDTSGRQGIIQDIEDKTDLGIGYISGDTNNLKDFTRRANSVMSDLWHTIWSVNSAWQYDDLNYTDLPTATTNLVSGQYKYALPSDALTINRAENLDQSGNLYRLSPLDLKNSPSIDFSQTGTPTHYYLVNGTSYLYPTPNYNSTNALKWYFDRSAVEFAYNDTTKKPGFASVYHYLVGLGVAINWLKVKQPNSLSLAQFIVDYREGKKQLEEFISERWGEITPVLKTTRNNFE